jgi:hypothetical protein
MKKHAFEILGVLFLKQCNVFKFEILKSKKKRLKYETKDM